MNLSASCNARLAEPLALLLLRLWLAQEFINAGFIKLSAGLTPPDWFAGLSFPPPVSWLPASVNWLAAGAGELVLGALLLIGFCSRFAASGLLFIVWLAVLSVHYDLGLGGWNQIETDAGLGFKLPLMMALMLLVLLVQGGGRWSLDTLVRKRKKRDATDAV